MMMNKTWTPSQSDIEDSNIYKMMQQIGVTSFADFWKWSVTHKTAFWAATLERLGIVQAQKYTHLLDLSEGVEKAKWLFGAQMNIVDSCFQNKSDATVICFQKEGGSVQKISQQQLENLVNRVANGLQNAGGIPGDVIALMMPMTLEATVLYLAGIKAGMAVSTIADSFAPNEVSLRLEIAKPTFLFTQDFIHRKGTIHDLYHKICTVNPPKMVVVQTKPPSSVTLRSQDVFWDDFLSENNQFTSVKQSPQATTTVLFSSGTTGIPKAIPWDHTTPIKSASDGHYHHNIQKNDVVCWPTNLGWMMGPWLVFATLINKATIALYYGTPLQAEFGGFVEAAKVTLLGLVPSMVKQWKQSRVMEPFDWSSIQCMSSTGEVSNAIEMNYLMELAQHKPIIEYCGGTEIGGGYVASTLLQENKPSQFSCQTLGGEFVLLNERGDPDTQGEVFLIPPILGLSTRLLNKDHHATYYRGTPVYNSQILRRHGDLLQVTKDGYFKAQGRTDDTMNLGGIKVAAVQIEKIVNALAFVAEAAAVAIAPKEGGSNRLVVFYVAREIHPQEEAFQKVKNAVKTKLNPLFKVVDLVKIDNLPRTASMKIKRKDLREKYGSYD
jgi:acetyl-CoA synthetase